MFKVFRDCLQRHKMVHVCTVPGCHSRSDREKQLSFYRLLLSNHHLLKKWASNIGRKDLPLNNNTRVCSLHFQSGKNKYSNEVPTLKLPKTPHHINVSKRNLQRNVYSCVYRNVLRNVKLSQLALTFNGRPE